MQNYEEYDYRVIKEIARHELEPNLVQKSLNTIGKPIDLLYGYVQKSENKYVKKAIRKIDKTVQDVLKVTVKMANQLTSEENVRKEYKKQFGIELTKIDEIKNLKLEQMDRVADSYDVSNGFFVATEGALLGLATTIAEGFPFAQIAIPSLITADVTASMTLMSRHVCQIATSYGYSSFDLINIPDILAAMAPTSTSSDEGFLIIKAAAVHEIREASKFSAKHVGELVNDIATPNIIALIRKVAERLGIIITQKELGLLVPIAGALVNGGLNLAFQQMNHTSAKDYFRKAYLAKKYGEQDVFNAIQAEKLLLTEKAAG